MNDVTDPAPASVRVAIDDDADPISVAYGRAERGDHLVPPPSDRASLVLLAMRALECDENQFL